MIKRRNCAIQVILSLLTCGLYSFYWIAVMADDVNRVSGSTKATPGELVVLFSLLTCGIYELYWLYTAGDKLDAARTKQGLPGNSLGIIFLLLAIFGIGIISLVLIQNELNKYAQD